jgi:hypothetical protein
MKDPHPDVPARSANWDVEDTFWSPLHRIKQRIARQDLVRANGWPASYYALLIGGCLGVSVGVLLALLEASRRPMPTHLLVELFRQSSLLLAFLGALLGTAVVVLWQVIRPVLIALFCSAERFDSEYATPPERCRNKRAQDD